LEPALDILGDLKTRLVNEYAAWEKINVSVMSPIEVFDILKTQLFSKVVFDVRTKEQYIDGHLKWASSQPYVEGIINLEPDLIVHADK